MTRCDADPGIYSKRAGKDGRENVTMNLYVDDGKLYSDPTPAGKAERDHIHRLIHAVGELVHGPIEVGVDNKGAYDLCHRTTTGKNSRHVERKVWKMRELHALDVVKLVLVPTEDMCADMLTKPLDDKTFHKHRKECMNLL
jgi:hypothetical protein